jgi:hypothetical protein
LKTFLRKDVPAYAILSHTWGSEEISFEDITGKRFKRLRKEGWFKIKKCCAQAIEDGLNWVWIDTCCIDKSSSAELSEAINSMYRWYANASVCYVYLKDVVSRGPLVEDKELAVSRWFKRGWTLQELLAPDTIVFYNCHWVDIGTKKSLHLQISTITGIDTDLLQGYKSPQDFTVAHRMSWASERKTSRDEDIAYCLLGIFDVHMPLIYGEGSRAFVRLQEEILKINEDYTLFLWVPHPDQKENVGALATSPVYFPHQGILIKNEDRCPYSEIKMLERQAIRSIFVGLGPGERWEPPKTTSRGLQITLPLHDEGLDTRSFMARRLASFFCVHKTRGLLCIELQQLKFNRLEWKRPDQQLARFIALEMADRFYAEELYLVETNYLSIRPRLCVPEYLRLDISRYGENSLSVIATFPEDEEEGTETANLLHRSRLFGSIAVGGLLFQRNGSNSQDRFMVSFGVESVHPGKLQLFCLLHTSVSDRVAFASWFSDERRRTNFEELTDRANGKLSNGSVVYVSFERCFHKELDYVLKVSVSPVNRL